MTDRYDDLEEGSVTRGGSVIMKGKPRKDTFRAPETAAENCDLIEDYLTPVLGPSSTVFHEIISDIVHLDVLVFPPQERGGDWTYVTSGMGDLRMTLPDGLDPVEFGRAEMCIRLPKAWGQRISRIMDDQKDGDEDAFWPISLLKGLARYPHAESTFLGAGHTVPMGGPLAGDTPMDGVLIHSPIWLPDMDPLRLPDGDELTFLTYTPLHPEEMAFKLEHGTDALYDCLDAAGVGPALDPHRPSAIRKKWSLRSLFGG
ncbi:MAG: suppressor of fused domain protein [Pseudomonadota bacterium]